MATNDVPTFRYHKSSQAKEINPRWWNLKEEDVAMHLFPLVKDIERRQLWRRAANTRFAKLYGPTEQISAHSGITGLSSAELQPQNMLSLNVVRACVDTVASKISKAKPRPMFLTEGGDWSMQRRAKLLTKYTDGAFDQMDFYRWYQMGFRDSEIFGTGAIKFFKDGTKVACERTLIDELVVDDAEAIYGQPQQLHQVKYVHRDILAEQYPEKREEIKHAAPGFSGQLFGPASQHLIRVVESWHLASGPHANDGAHAIVIDGVTLVMEPYKRKRFPFVFLRWSEKLTGFFGSGIPEELWGIQLELRKLLRTVQRAMHLMCVPRVWIESNSQVNGQMTNEVGAVGTYTGVMPQIVPGQAMSPEVYQHIENLYKKAFEQVGVSQMSAAAKKPAGLDSGIALREFQDIESERFQLVQQRYDAGAIEAAEILIEMTQEIFEELKQDGKHKDLAVKVKEGKTIKQIKWAEIDLERDQYEMRAFPTSILPTTPAGKLQTIQEMVQAGLIDMETGRSLLDFPDLEGAMSLANAAVDDIKRCLEFMIEEGKYQTPEPFMNLQLALTMTQSAYLKARCEGVPEERLDLLRRFIEDVQALITQAQAPAPGQTPVDPMAVPEAPPTSDLMPVQGAGDPMAAMGVMPQ